MDHENINLLNSTNKDGQTNHFNSYSNMWATVWQQLNTVRPISSAGAICIYFSQCLCWSHSWIDLFKVSVTFWWVTCMKMVNLLHIAQAYLTMSCIGVDIGKCGYGCR